MSPKLPANLSFQRPEHRAEFERARGVVKGAIGTVSNREALGLLQDLAGDLDAAVARLKRDLLGSALCWNEDNQALTAWIHQQYRRVADMALRLVELEGATGTAVVALLLHHEGEAMKWIAARVRPDLSPLNALMARAYDDGFATRPFSFSVEARGCTATLESLYLRLLLLDRLGTGVLTRQQVELLDAWLLDWAPKMRLHATPPAGAALHVNLAGSQGLRGEQPDAAGGRVRYLPLAPLEERRRQVARELQLGNLVPAFGCAAEFRIEEHVAVLRHLERTLRAPQDASARREERESAPGTRVEAWLGLNEILARAGNPRSAVETGQWRSLSLEGAKEHAADPGRRYLWLYDTSASGCGFEALEQDAEGVEIGDLVGWRRDAGIALGRVIRRLPGASAGQVFLGVRLLTDCGSVHKLRRVDGMNRDDGVATFLYVPGDDPSGRRDAFLVPETAFSQEHAYATRVGDESYVLRFNRVRDRGRGWVLGGFEIEPPRPAVAPIAEGMLVLAELDPVANDESLDFVYDPQPEVPPLPAASSEDDPWSREVPLRLLD